MLKVARYNLKLQTIRFVNKSFVMHGILEGYKLLNVITIGFSLPV